MTTETLEHTAVAALSEEPCALCGHPLHAGQCSRFLCHCFADLPAREGAA